MKNLNGEIESLKKLLTSDKEYARQLEDYIRDLESEKQNYKRNLKIVLKI